MDLTLNQLIQKVNKIHSEINKLDADSNRDRLNTCIYDLQNLERQIGVVYMKVSNILANKNNIIKQEIVSCKNVAHDIPINVKIVNDVSEIPNNPIYWVSNINQFAFHINGVIMRGNIGNIYNQRHIKKNIHVNQTIICKQHNKCKNLIYEKNICKFYHDPVELLELLGTGQITDETFKIYKNRNRNFINTSWLYTDLPCNKKNTMMRHFGSKNVLNHEFDLMKIDNSKINENIIDNYKQQTMHDILVIMGLNQCDLLKKYPE